MTDEYTIAPQHSTDLEELDPIVFEGVAYSPLKFTFLSSSHDENLLVVCESCSWETKLVNLPQSEMGGYEQPDMCPDCAKKDKIGHLRKQPTGIGESS